MVNKKTHGLMVLKFDSIDKPTLEDFKDIFRFHRSFFKEYNIKSAVRIGEVTYDKDDFTERLVYINNDEHRIKFNKRNNSSTYTNEQELEWRNTLNSIYGTSWKGKRDD